MGKSPEDLWRDYQTAQASADHTAKECFIEVVSQMFAPPRPAGTCPECGVLGDFQEVDTHAFSAVKVDAYRCSEESCGVQVFRETYHHDPDAVRVVSAVEESDERR